MEDNSKVFIDLYPFVAEAISYNKAVYTEVDKLYSKYEYEFYKCAENNKYYNHNIIKEKSLIQEEYAKKALGILSFYNGLHDLDITPTEQQLNDINNGLQNIYRKGWQYIVAYIDNHTVIDVQQFINAFSKKKKGCENLSTVAWNGMISILYIIALNKGRTFVEDDTYRYFLKMFNMRIKLGWPDSPNQSLSKGPLDEYKKQIETLKEKIYSTCKTVRTIEDVLKLADKYFPAEIVDLIIAPNDTLSLIDILDDTQINDSDLEFILSKYMYCSKELESPALNSGYNEFNLYLVYSLILTLLFKHYEQVKEYYFKNSKQTLYIKIEQMQNELKKESTEIKKVEAENENLRKIIPQQEKELSKLKNGINKSNINSQELYGLREYIFRLSDTNKYTCEEDSNIDISSIVNANCAVLGGYPRWQDKMKELLPNFIYLSVDNINFDTNILKKCDVIFINISCLSHALYYKVMNSVKKTKQQIVYLDHKTNIPMNVRQIYETVLKAGKEDRKAA